MSCNSGLPVCLSPTAFSFVAEQLCKCPLLCQHDSNAEDKDSGKPNALQHEAGIAFEEGPVAKKMPPFSALTS